jgi:hypothetical protein
VGERAGKEEPAAVGAGAGIVQQFAGMKDNGVESRTWMNRLRRRFAEKSPPPMQNR